MRMQSLIFLFISVIFTLAITSVNATNYYDQQIGIAFNGSFRSIAYNVTALAQNSSDCAGPSYILNGWTPSHYWYQIFISYNYGFFCTDSKHPEFDKFYVGYEVFTPSQGLTNESASVETPAQMIKPNDKITLSLSFYNGNVIMQVKDRTSGYEYAYSYGAFGSNIFTQNGPQGDPNGATTSLMTEELHLTPYYGNESRVSYQPSGGSVSGGWLYAAESECIFNSTVRECLSHMFRVISPEAAQPYQNCTYFVGIDNETSSYLSNGTVITGGASPGNGSFIQCNSSSMKMWESSAIQPIIVQQAQPAKPDYALIMAILLVAAIASYIYGKKMRAGRLSASLGDKKPVQL